MSAVEQLEGLYERYGARLFRRTDGYSFLVPSGNRLPRRQPTTGEVLVGQALALLYQGPATLESTGVVDRSTALERLIRGGEVVTAHDDEDPQLAEAVSEDSPLDDGADEAGEDPT